MQNAKSRRDALKLGSFAIAGAAVGGSQLAPDVALGQSARLEGIVVGGKTIDLKSVQERGSQLNQALQNETNFKAFADDPVAFSRQHGLELDPTLGMQIKQKLQGVPSLDAAKARGGDGGDLTVAAVAKGAFAMSDSKIAVAF